MTPRERRIIGRLLIVASVLMAAMVAAMFWTALQSETRTPPPSQPGAGEGAGP